VIHSRTVILQFCQIVKQRSHLLFFFLFSGSHDAFLRGDRLQKADQLFGGFPFFESVLLIQFGRIFIGASADRPPFGFQALSCQLKASDDPVERSLHESTDFPFAPNDHPEHARHDPSDRYGRPLCPEIIRDSGAVLQRQQPGEIDSHQIIFLGTQIGCIA